MSKQSFTEAYRLARTNRRSPLWQGQFFRFDGGDIYISDGHLILCRNGRSAAYNPGAVVGMLASGFSNSYRRMAIETAQAVGPVPLP